MGPAAALPDVHGRRRAALRGRLQAPNERLRLAALEQPGAAVAVPRGEVRARRHAIPGRRGAEAVRPGNVLKTGPKNN